MSRKPPVQHEMRGTWYDLYEKGLKAARDEDWPAVDELMTAAIAKNPKEDSRARTYGAIFINYRPYYYRGYAKLKMERYREATADLEQSFSLGSPNTMPTPQPRIAYVPQPVPVSPPVSSWRPGAEIIVAWAMLALINAALAQAKGRSGAVWFLLSLILGPLATLVIILQGPIV